MLVWSLSLYNTCLLYTSEFNVKTWADVLMYTLKVVSDLAPDKLENIETDYPSLVGKNAKILEDLKSCAMNIIMNQI